MKPDKFPDWATEEQIDPVSGQNNVVEPPDIRKQSGWTRREIPPRQWFNWLAKKTAEWLRWFEPRADKVDAATPGSTPNTLILRDASGRAEITTPEATAEIANKGYVDTVAAATAGEVGTLADNFDGHVADTDPHSATPEATPNRIILRDASGRAQVAAPSAEDDIARKADVDAHAAETSTHGAPTGEDLLHSGDVGTASGQIPTNGDLPSSSSVGNEPNKLVKYEDDGAGGPRLPAADGSQLTGLGGVGEYKFVQEDLTGASVPNPDLWIKLEAGLTGAGEYNEGKLTNESVTGSAPLVIATATISDSGSPMNGQTVHLLETEERFLRAGQSGRVQFDQMQLVTGSVELGAATDRAPGQGALSYFRGSVDRAAASVGSGNSGLRFNSANSPNARTSSTTDGETRAKNIGVAVYLRIK